jgi:hypothetical protein
MLRDRFRINGNHKELTRNVSSNIRRVPETSERFQTLSEMFRLKNYAKGIVN